MIDIYIPSLLELVRKDREIISEEKERLDDEIMCLYTTYMYVGKDNVITNLTYEQERFVREVLPVAIRADLPKLDKVMEIYGLSIETVFVKERTPEEGWRTL
jgi:hypothetical protein